jgi:1,4-dihydroxy-2-naphthoyl-CoA hydrolase
MTLEDFNAMCPNTLMETLGIVYTYWDGECLSAEMEVTPGHHQPYGTLHGGASAALAESVGSALSWALVDQETEVAVGVEINANHVRPVRKGIIKAEARILYKGSSIHVVDIRISEANGKLVAVSRLTNKIIRK